MSEPTVPLRPHSLRRVIVAAASAIAVALACAAPALGAIVLTTPPDGATVSGGLPPFAWTTDQPDTSSTIWVSDSSARDAHGGLASFVDTAYRSGAAPTWVPAQRLLAGSYWWLVQQAPAGAPAVDSEVRSFTVPVELRLSHLTVESHQQVWLGGSMSLVTNVRTVAMTVRVFAGRRTVSTVRTVVPTDRGSALQRRTVPWSWIPFSGPHLARGTHFRVVVTLSGMGRSVTASRTLVQR